MSFHTTVKVVGKDGRPAKANVKCGGVDRGFTDERSGEVSFEVRSNDAYDVTAKRYDEVARGQVKGGGYLVVRLG